MLSGPWVMHYAYDDSVFIDEQYVIKGVPGRLLMFMLEIHARDGRCEFSNRELRLAPAIRLPDSKDNLEPGCCCRAAGSRRRRHRCGSCAKGEGASGCRRRGGR